MTVSEKVPVAVAPLASVTVTLKVEVPSVVGSPISRPEGRSVNPAGTWPDQVYGCVPLLARNGKVYGVIFAASTSARDTGFALTASVVRPDVRLGGNATAKVSTRRCPRPG